MFEYLHKIKVTTIFLFICICFLLVFSFKYYFRETAEPPGCGVKDEPSWLYGNVMTKEESLGNDIFKESCNRCHFSSDKKLVGPGLKDVSKRTASEKWLRAFIGNSDSVSKSGDRYALASRKKYEVKFNHNYVFSDKDWNNLLLYINSF